eukprot:6551048-Pyramimonas_sp.AAC.1
MGTFPMRAVSVTYAPLQVVSVEQALGEMEAKHYAAMGEDSDGEPQSPEAAEEESKLELLLRQLSGSPGASKPLDSDEGSGVDWEPVASK